MQVHRIARLVTASHSNAIRRTLSRGTLPIFRTLNQSGSIESFEEKQTNQYRYLFQNLPIRSVMHRVVHRMINKLKMRRRKRI